MQVGTLIPVGGMRSFQLKLFVVEAAAGLADRSQSGLEQAVRKLEVFGRLVLLGYMLELAQGNRCSARPCRRRQPGPPKDPSIAWIP